MSQLDDILESYEGGKSAESGNYTKQQIKALFSGIVDEWCDDIFYTQPILEAIEKL